MRYEHHLPPATIIHTLHLAHALYKGNTRYGEEVCYRTHTLDTYKENASPPRRERGSMVWRTTKLNWREKVRKHEKQEGGEV